MSEYLDARHLFLSRAAALLPNVMHGSQLLDELGDSYPEIHTMGRDYVCAADSHEEIISKTNALTDEDVKIILLDKIPGALCDEIDDYEDGEFTLSQYEADDLIKFAREIDPDTAVEISDLIRNNFEHITL